MSNTPSLIQVPVVSGSVQGNIDGNLLTTNAGVVQRQVITVGDPATADNYQACDGNGNAQTKIGPALTPLLTALPINFSGSGLNAVIPAVVNKIIRVYRLWFVVGGATSITFEDGSNPLSGAAPLLMGGGITLDHSGEPWYVGTEGNAFNLNSSNAVEVAGTVYFVQQ